MVKRKKIDIFDPDTAMFLIKTDTEPFMKPEELSFIVESLQNARAVNQNQEPEKGLEKAHLAIENIRVRLQRCARAFELVVVNYMVKPTRIAIFTLLSHNHSTLTILTDTNQSTLDGEAHHK